MIVYRQMTADDIDAFARLGFGFIEIGTVTPRPQPGNPKPRLFRIPERQAIINRMGFNNKGVDHLVERVKAARYRGVLGINIGKNFDTAVEDATSDYLICLNKVYEHATYITVNISSPNTPGLRTLQFGESLQQLLAPIKARQLELAEQFGYKPVFVKIAPDMTEEEVGLVAETLINSGIDGVIATIFLLFLWVVLVYSVELNTALAAPLHGIFEQFAFANSPKYHPVAIGDKPF